MISVATTQFREYVEEPTSSDGSVARGLLRRMTSCRWWIVR